MSQLRINKMHKHKKASSQHTKIYSTFKQQSERDQLVQDLIKMYQVAFHSQNYAVALKAIELRGKELGLFGNYKKNYLKSIKEMSEQELAFLLGEGKEN